MKEGKEDGAGARCRNFRHAFIADTLMILHSRPGFRDILFAINGSLDRWTPLPVRLVAYAFFGLEALGCPHAGSVAAQ